MFVVSLKVYFQSYDWYTFIIAGTETAGYGGDNEKILKYLLPITAVALGFGYSFLRPKK